MDLDDPAAYPHSFCATLEFAIFLHAVRRPPAGGARNQIEVSLLEVSGATGTNWRHAGLFGGISLASGEAIQRVGRCRFPPHLTATMSVDLPELRRII